MESRGVKEVSDFSFLDERSCHMFLSVQLLDFKILF